MIIEITMTTELRETCLNIVLTSDPGQKCQLAASLEGMDGLDCAREFPDKLEYPGRPNRPQLVAPALVQRRSMTTVAGRAAMIHALAHIEMNAINLAADIVWRFAGMPERFYRDWARVCVEEAYHFNLLREHLRQGGYDYGDFDAHNSLWEMAYKTRADLLARLALVPRTMEAKGLDASPNLIHKLKQAGVSDVIPILEIIVADEVGHVAIGNYWFNYLCQQRQLNPLATYRDLAKLHAAPVLRGPFNLPARRLAGFTEEELQDLQTMAENARG